MHSGASDSERPQNIAKERSDPQQSSVAPALRTHQGRSGHRGSQWPPGWPPRGHPSIIQKVKRARDLKAQGLRPADIGRVIGVGRTTVYRYLKLESTDEAMTQGQGTAGKGSQNTRAAPSDPGALSHD